MLRGGRTKDGGYIIGDSVFYSGSNSPNDATPPPDKSVDRLDFELRVCGMREITLGKLKHMNSFQRECIENILMSKSHFRKFSLLISGCNRRDLMIKIG